MNRALHLVNFLSIAKLCISVRIDYVAIFTLFRANCLEHAYVNICVIEYLFRSKLSWKAISNLAHKNMLFLAETYLTMLINSSNVCGLDALT